MSLPSGIMFLIYINKVCHLQCVHKGELCPSETLNEISYSFSRLLSGPNSIIKGCCHYSARLQILAFPTRVTPVRIPV